ncbi:hypothetical protein BLOT_010364, partial [Blomia tropicalis]
METRKKWTPINQTKQVKNLFGWCKQPIYLHILFLVESYTMGPNHSLIDHSSILTSISSQTPPPPGSAATVFYSSPPPSPTSSVSSFSLIRSQSVNRAMSQLYQSLRSPLDSLKRKTKLRLKSTLRLSVNHNAHNRDYHSAPASPALIVDHQIGQPMSANNKGQQQQQQQQHELTTYPNVQSRLSNSSCLSTTLIVEPPNQFNDEAERVSLLNESNLKLFIDPLDLYVQWINERLIKRPYITAHYNQHGRIYYLNTMNDIIDIDDDGGGVGQFGLIQHQNQIHHHHNLMGDNVGHHHRHHRPPPAKLKFRSFGHFLSFYCGFEKMNPITLTTTTTGTTADTTNIDEQIKEFELEQQRIRLKKVDSGKQNRKKSILSSLIQSFGRNKNKGTRSDDQCLFCLVQRYYCSPPNCPNNIRQQQQQQDMEMNNVAHVPYRPLCSTLQWPRTEPLSMRHNFYLCRRNDDDDDYDGEPEEEEKEENVKLVFNGKNQGEGGEEGQIKSPNSMAKSYYELLGSLAKSNELGSPIGECEPQIDYFCQTNLYSWELMLVRNAMFAYDPFKVMSKLYAWLIENSTRSIETSLTNSVETINSKPKVALQSLLRIKGTLKALIDRILNPKIFKSIQLKEKNCLR